MLQPDLALCSEKEEVVPTPQNLVLSEELLRKDTLHTLGENAAAVLHELRGPLQAMRAHVQLLERKLCPGEGGELQRHFPPIYQGMDHINALLDQFLRLSRLADSQLAYVDIHACLQEILPLLRSMAIMRNIELSAELDPNTPGCIGDEQQLKRLLFNLFANACDAITTWQKQQGPVEQRKPQIQLQLKRDGASIMLSVEDNGCGIRKDKLRQIWEPFFTDKPAGTGLGLPSCAAIAEQHGGSLTVTSNSGEGSRFILRLPIKMA